MGARCPHDVSTLCPRLKLQADKVQSTDVHDERNTRCFPAILPPGSALEGFVVLARHFECRVASEISPDLIPQSTQIGGIDLRAFEWGDIALALLQHNPPLKIA